MEKNWFFFLKSDITIHYLLSLFYFRNRQSPGQPLSNQWEEEWALGVTRGCRSTSHLIRKSLRANQGTSRCKQMPPFFTWLMQQSNYISFLFPYSLALPAMPLRGILWYKCGWDKIGGKQKTNGSRDWAFFFFTPFPLLSYFVAKYGDTRTRGVDANKRAVTTKSYSL